MVQCISQIGDLIYILFAMVFACVKIYYTRTTTRHELLNPTQNREHCVFARLVCLTSLRSRTTLANDVLNEIV